MQRHAFAMGQAGTGKTTWLIQQIRSNGPQLLVADQQRVMALTFMHGARRRLDAAIRAACPGLRFTATTIDGFALSLVNRWRSALQLPKVVVGCQGDRDFEEDTYSVRAGFNRILKAASQLVQTASVSQFVRSSYPLIAVDEFQDCHGERLEFVKWLGACSRLIVAADEFQLLDVSVQGCPAVDWAKALHGAGHADIADLQNIHRTTDATILESARCLRSGAGPAGSAVTVQCFNGEGEAAYRVLEAIYFTHPKGAPFGTKAIIAPSRAPVLGSIVSSFETQCAKRSLKPLKWRGESNEADATAHVLGKLAIANGAAIDVPTLVSMDCSADPAAALTQKRLLRLSRLKGLNAIPPDLITETVERTVHGLRAFGPACTSCIITTVHGAKNREFDDVFVVWPFQVPPDAELQRRLLYNAITRAKRRCILLVQGGVKRAQGDPVLQLLGVPVPVFPSRKKSTAAKVGGKKQSS